MEETEKISGERRTKAIYKVTIIGTIVNFVLVVFKFVAGVIGRSDAMLADAAHSLSDFVSDVVVLWFVRLSSKPQDRDHDFGHGKYETLATAIIGLLLFAAGAGIFWKGSVAIWDWAHGAELEQPGWIALIAALASLGFKEVLYRYTVRVGRRIDSQVVIANAWHHRSDSLSSFGTAIGIGGAILLGTRWRVLDPVAAVIVSFFILKVAYKLTIPCLGELLEKSLPDDEEQRILDTVADFPKVHDPHNMRTRKVGQTRVVDLHVRMDGDMTITESHHIVTDIERRLRSFLGRDAIITIHVEPVK